MPAILIAMLFRYIFAFRLFSEVWLLTQGGPARTTEVLAVYLYLEAFRYNAFGVAAATGWLLVLASLVLAVWYLRRLYKEMFATYALGPASSARSARQSGSTLFAAWSLVPIVMIVMSSFKADRDIFAVPQRWLFTPTFVNYETLVTRWGDFFRALVQQPDHHGGRDAARDRGLDARRLRLFALPRPRARVQRLLPHLHPPDPADRHHAAAVSGRSTRSA